MIRTSARIDPPRQLGHDVSRDAPGEGHVLEPDVQAEPGKIAVDVLTGGVAAGRRPCSASEILEGLDVAPEVAGRHFRHDAADDVVPAPRPAARRAGPASERRKGRMLVEGRASTGSPAGIRAAGSPASVQKRRIPGSISVNRPALSRAARVSTSEAGKRMKARSPISRSMTSHGGAPLPQGGDLAPHRPGQVACPQLLDHVDLLFGQDVPQPDIPFLDADQMDGIDGRAGGQDHGRQQGDGDIPQSPHSFILYYNRRPLLFPTAAGFPECRLIPPLERLAAGTGTGWGLSPIVNPAT